MKTVYNSLTFYDTLAKQEYNRFRQTVPIHSPRHQLPPFIIMGNGDTLTHVDKVDLCNKNVSDNPDICTAPANHPTAGYDTFTVAGNAITSGINLGGSAIGTITINQAIAAGEFIDVEFTLTLNSGTAPKVRLMNSGVTNSNMELTASGFNRITLQSYTGTSTIEIQIYNFDVSNFSTDAILVYKNTITGVFQSVPAVYNDATLGKYIEYKGTTLKFLIPRGEWYLKVSVDGYVYYSEYFSVSDIYENLITTFSNSAAPSDYQTFYIAGTRITSAINSAGSGIVNSNHLNVKNGETIRVIFYCNKTSGTFPTIYLSNIGWSASDNDSVAEGLNVIDLVSTWEGNSVIIFYNNASNVSFTTSEILVIRSYSSNFCKLKFYNSANLGELLYIDSFYQEVWLEAILHHPSHESIEVGEEKDGIFIAEKITTKMNYSIVARICNALYQALVRLPQHSSITITDEVGNIYSPAPGNISIEPPEWEDYNTVKAVIKFNNDSTSNFSWVK